MPGYRVHRKIGKLVSVLTAGGVFVAANVIYRGLQVINVLPDKFADQNMIDTLIFSSVIALGTYFGGTMDSPDLDIPSAPYNSWGPLRYIWLPYQIVVQHRSPISHWPVLSTVFKFFYLFVMANIILAILFLFANLFSIAMGWDWRVGITVFEVALITIRPFGWGYTWLFMLGDIIGEAVHSLTDFLNGRRSRRYRGAPVPSLSEQPPETSSLWRERR